MIRNWLSSKILVWGRRKVEDGDDAGARRAARILRRLRYTGEYELLARIALTQGEPERAVEILRGPADRHPKVWLLDSFLGEAFSNQGAYAAARERFERVYENAGPAGSALFNLAVVATREGDHAEALALLDRSAAEGEPILGEGPAETRAFALAGLDRLDEAEAILRGLQSNKTPALLALVLARAGRSDEAWAQVHRSFRLDPGRPEACEATRILLGGMAAREYRVLLDGLIDPATHPLGRRLGFFTMAWINADDEAEALAVARRIEPDLLDLRLEESDWTPVGGDARRGYVARRPGHTLYRNVASWDR